MLAMGLHALKKEGMGSSLPELTRLRMLETDLHHLNSLESFLPRILFLALRATFLGLPDVMTSRSLTFLAQRKR